MAFNRHSNYNYSFVEFILKTNKKHNLNLLNTFDSCGELPIHKICSHQHLLNLKSSNLLKEYANTLAGGEKKYPPLYFAGHSNPKCLELLIEAGADVNWKDEKGNTILHLWAQDGVKSPMIEELCKYLSPFHCSLRNSDEKTALDIVVGRYLSPRAIVRESYIDTIKTLVKVGVPVSASHLDHLKQQENPIYISNFRRNLLCLKELGLLKAYANATLDFTHSYYSDCLKILSDKEKYPALYFAHSWEPDCLELLIKEGADVNWKDEKGNTILHLWIERGASSSLIETLCKYLAPSTFSSCNTDGQTVLDKAIDWHFSLINKSPRDREIVDKIVSQFFLNKINDCRSPSNAPIDQKKNIRDIIEILIKAGAPISSQTKKILTQISRYV